MVPPEVLETLLGFRELDRSSEIPKTLHVSDEIHLKELTSHTHARA